MLPAPPASPIRVLHYMGINYGMTGVESFILQLTTAQKRAGLQPGVTMEIAGREELERATSAVGVPMFDFPPRLPAPSRVLARPLRIVNSVRRILALRRLLAGYDVIHLHSSGFVGLEALLAAALAGTRAIVVTHHMTVTIYRKYWSRMGTLTLWLQKRLATASVMPYAEAARELVEVGLPADRVKVIPYCIDEQKFAGENVPPADTDALRLIMVARLHDGKGQDVLLDALAELKRRNVPVSLIMVGRGDTRAALLAQIAALGLQDCAELREHVDHDQIPAMLRAAHVIVLPSFMEGETFPLSLLEGQLLGLPAIGSRWFGIPSIIADGETGIVVSPQSASELAAAIERLAGDRPLYHRMRTQAQARARASFTGTAVAATYLELYQAALAQR